jgi:hypothetical protein
MPGKIQCEVYGELQVKFVIPSGLAVLWAQVALGGVLWFGPDGTMPQLDKHGVIFLGELTNINQKTGDCQSPMSCRFDYTFRVLKVYKGKLNGTVVLRQAQYRIAYGVSYEDERGTYLMYADYQDLKGERRLFFDRTSTSPSFVYSKVSIQDWGDMLPSFDDLRVFWQSHLSVWMNLGAVKVNEPQNLVQISRDEVIRVVVQNRPKLIPCYGGTFAPLKMGPLSLKYKLSSEGKLLSVLPMNGGNSSAYDQIKRCFIDVTKNWTFPHKSAKEAEFVLVFE